MIREDNVDRFFSLTRTRGQCISVFISLLTLNVVSAGKYCVTPVYASNGRESCDTGQIMLHLWSEWKLSRHRGHIVERRLCL